VVNAGSDPLDNTAADASFDVLSDLSATPATGDFIVIGNQNTNDVYTGATRGTASAWQSPPAPGGALVGTGRITLSAATQFPSGYDGGRFFIVDQNEPSVFYVCRNAGEVGGNGTGELVRLTQGLNPAYPAVCPAAGGVRLARGVAACTFDYTPGVTQQSGFVWMHIELLEAGERVSLAYGAHVSNVP
jgi:MSHA biogenesis protein MshO